MGSKGAAIAADVSGVMWHYLSDEQPVGPVSEGSIATLIGEGTIQAETYVWREGFEDWRPAGDVPDLAPHMVPAAAGLALRQVPRDFTLTEEETREPVTMESLRAPLTAMNELENAEPEAGFFSWLVFLSPFEFKAFVFTALLAGIGSGVLHFLRPELVMAPPILQGLLCVVLAGIIFRVRTFQVGIGWGIAGLLIGITDLVFLFVHWDYAKRPFLLYLAGGAVMFASVFFWPMQETLQMMETLP